MTARQLRCVDYRHGGGADALDARGRGASHASPRSRGLSGELTWLQVADILGRSPRSIRRLRWRFEHYGDEGLYDGRRVKPAPKRAPLVEVERKTHGLPMALYTDRARWAVHTPTSGIGPDRGKLTQVGRALHRLGIEHILGYSPQARGRSERVNRTLQDRLVNELRAAGIRTLAAANAYLRDRFLPALNAEFGRPPTDPVSAFVPLGRVDLEQILCHEEARAVGPDNTVRLDGLVLQIAKQRGRRTCAGLQVVIRRHLNGMHAIWWGTRCLGRYSPTGQPVSTTAA